MRGVKAAARILSIVLVVLMGLLLACNLYVLAVKAITGEQQPTVFGFSSAVVVSGSMSGSIEINDMVVYHTAKEYNPGDVICFERGNSVVTHRIVRQTADGFVTKGDANNTEDTDPVTQAQIIGRAILVIPGIGALTAYFRTPMGLLTLLLAALLLIETPVLFRWIKTKKGT